MSRLRVALGVPSFKYYEHEFVHSLIRMIAATVSRSRAEFSFISETRTYRHLARQSIAQSALDSGVHKLLMMDDDMVFPPETLLQLLAHDKPIVSALYFLRKLPTVPVAYNRGSDMSGRSFLPPIHGFPDYGLLEVAACGAGCILIDREVLLRMQHVNFGYETIGKLGEDIGFCLMAKEFGFQTFVDCGLKIGHVSAERPIIDYTSYKSEKNMAELRARKIPC